MRQLGRNPSGLGAPPACALHEGWGWNVWAVGACYFGAGIEERHWDLKRQGKGVGSAALRVLLCFITTLKMRGGSDRSLSSLDGMRSPRMPEINIFVIFAK